MVNKYERYLTLYYSVAMSITVLIFSIILYLLISKYLYGIIDESLLKIAKLETASALEIEGNKKDSNEHEEPHIHYSTEGDEEVYGVADRMVRIFSYDGNIIESYPANKGFNGEVNKHIFTKLEINGHYAETIDSPSGLIRSIYIPISKNGMDITYVVQVGTHIKNIINMMSGLKWILAVLNIVVVLLSIFLSKVMSKKAVSPLNTISETALKIDFKNLDQRLDIKSSFYEIARLVDILNEMLDRIKAGAKSQKEFIANVSHEIQSPLTIIKGSIEVAIRHDRDPSEYIDVMKSILEEADRMSNMVNDLLVLSSADEKSLVLKYSFFDMNNLIRDIVNIKRKDAIDRKVSVHFRSKDEVIRVEADIDMIKRAVYNLVDNAVKYTQSDGEIIVSTYLRDGHAVVEVKDNGVGISEDDIQKVFERFFRADRSRSRKTGGTGLGLSIVKEIALMHKGEVSVKSKLGEGSIFSLTFPMERLG